MKLLISLLIVLNFSATALGAQQKMPQKHLRIYITSLSPSRTGFHSKASLLIQWRAYVQNTQTGGWNEVQPQQINSIDCQITVCNQRGDLIVQKDPILFNYKLPKRLSAGKYDVKITPLNNNYMIENADSGNVASFDLKGTPASNAFTQSVYSIKKAIWKGFFVDFIGQGGVSGIIVSVFILFLFFIELYNIIAFISRLFFRIPLIGEKQSKRIFPKNKEKVAISAEIGRFFSFQNYGNQNEFVMNLEENARNKAWDNLDELLERKDKQGEEDSLLILCLREPYRKYREILNAYGKNRNWLARKQADEVFDDLVSTKIEQIGKGGKTSIFSLDVFWMSGAIAPMLGLFGTVLGIAFSFGELQFLKVNSVQQTAAMLSKNLAHNINMALNTTILGLIVGIFSVACYYYFHLQMESIKKEVARIYENFKFLLNL